MWLEDFNKNSEQTLPKRLRRQYVRQPYESSYLSQHRKMPPLFKLMRKMIDETQATVSGDVRLKLFRGNAIVVGRRSPHSLYDEKVATFEADTVYNQRDAEGFIKLNALRLRLGGER